MAITRFILMESILGGLLRESKHGEDIISSMLVFWMDSVLLRSVVYSLRTNRISRSPLGVVFHGV